MQLSRLGTITRLLPLLLLVSAGLSQAEKPDAKPPAAEPQDPQTPVNGHANEVEMRVMGSTLVTLYHELAHGLIDIYGLPMLGREEDAADSFALVELITQIRSPETDEATDAVLAEYGVATAVAWYQSARENRNSDQGAYFGAHALDQQRMFQTVCLLTGGEPDLFEGLSERLDIDSFYMMSCGRAFAQAYDGWVYTLDTFGAFHQSDEGRDTPDLTFTFAAPEDEAHVRWARLIENWAYLEEVQRHFSSSFVMDAPIEVTFKSCGEENAFYYPGEAKVIMCYDLMEAYARYARRPIESASGFGFSETLEQIIDEITPPESIDDSQP